MKISKALKPLLIASAVVAVLLFVWAISIKQTSPPRLRHYFTSNVETITDLSEEEQKKLLELFQVVIPDTETEAYICSFQKGTDGHKICSYLIEFDGVKSYQDFYKANINRKISDNVTDNISMNQMYGAVNSDGSDYDYYNAGDGDREHYLTYGLLAADDKSGDFSKLFDKIKER